MLHDLVLALYGVGGQIFAEGRAFRSAPDFPFLHEGERAVVDGALAEVCEAFRRVQIAVNPSATGAGASASGAFAEEPSSLYWRALVQAVDMYVITPYTDLLLNVERWLLLNGADGTISESDGSASVLDGSAVSADPPTPVSKNTTTPSTLTLDPGTAALFQGTRTPVSALALAFDGWRRLLPGVCTLVEQARDAMVAEGMSESSARGATDNGNGTGASAARMLDVLRTRAACAVGDERTVMLGLFHHVNACFLKQVSAWVLRGRIVDPYEEFFVREEADGSFAMQLQRIPSYVPPAVADQILFLGRALRTILASSKHQNPSEVIALDRHTRAFLAIAAAQPFRVSQLEDALHEVQQEISSVLWTVILDECKLSEHLRAFKDCFLLGKGEFFETLVEEFDRIAARSSATSEYELNHMLRRAAIKTSAEDDWALDRLRFRIANAQECAANPVLTLFADRLVGLPIRLDYHFEASEHPLGWVLTRSDLEDYNTMFILLMNLKRAQLHLRSTWIHHRDNDANHRYPSYRRLWMLRHSVALFLDSFATYIQADVITPHYTHLTALLHDYTAKRRGEGDVKMGTLDLAKTHRENYLAPIMARSFIRVPAVVEALREMVDVAMGLGRNMQAVFQSGDSVTQERSFTEFATELDRLQESFDRNSSFLYRSFQSISRMTGGTLLQNQMVSESIAELSLGMDRAAEVENEQETLVNDRALGKQDLGQLPNAMDALLLKLDYNRHYALRS